MPGKRKYPVHLSGCKDHWGRRLDGSMLRQVSTVLRVLIGLALYLGSLWIAYNLWIAAIHALVGNKVYSVLESVAKIASLAVPTLAVSLAYVRFFWRQSLDGIGLMLKRSTPLWVGAGLLFAAGYYGFFLLVNPSDVHILGINSHFSLLRFSLYGMAWFGIALTEETVFRGTIFRTAHVRIGLWTALLLSALLFGLLHGLPNPLMISGTDTQQVDPYLRVMITTLDGLLLGAARIGSGTLWFPIGIHLGLNFIPVNILSAPLKIQYPNGVLTIHSSAQLLQTQWQVDVSSLALEALLLTGFFYLTTIVALLLWGAKRKAF